MNTLELRDRIEEVLTGRIGVFVYNDGTEVPAIWSGGKVDPEIRETRGLEILISATPEIFPQRLGPETIRIEKQWEVVLVQRTSNTSIMEEVILLTAAFDWYRDPVVLKEDDNRFEQATVYPRVVEALTFHNAHQGV